jgi:hypothetical protein
MLAGSRCERGQLARRPRCRLADLVWKWPYQAEGILRRSAAVLVPQTKGGGIRWRDEIGVNCPELCRPVKTARGFP